MEEAAEVTQNVDVKDSSNHSLKRAKRSAVDSNDPCSSPGKRLRNSDGSETEKGKSLSPTESDPNPQCNKCAEPDTDCAGQPDDVEEFICEICVEPRSLNESFSIKGCSHAYCNHCLCSYIASKLQDNHHVSKIGCPVPGCGGVLELEYCRLILPPQLSEKWGSARKLCCPFEDCSAMLEVEEDDFGIVISEAECSNCSRLFCAKCRVPWHSDIDCAEFQKLPEDERERGDIELIKLAEERGWSRCPACRIFVEKTTGCDDMRCRCGRCFNYSCNKNWRK